MARQNINAGTGNLRGDGETLHTAFKKINENFIDLYQTSGPSYYVSENGVDSQDRSGQSQNDSWASIEYALSQITGPATVHVMAGDYTENLPLSVPENVSVVGESQRTVTVFPAENSTGQMWQMRDGALLAHMTFKGMTGFAPGANPTDIDDFTFDGVFVGLDPDSPIINKSPYIFDCSSISTGGIGALIDGSVHSSGNKSILIHAYTCINQDGLGYCAINNGKAEIVSGFTYYCHMGYAAGSGGILRSLNGNATYGTYGAVSQGFDATETPLTGTLYGDQIEFINLVGTFSEGDTVTGQTSLAEATVTDFQANAKKLYVKVTSGTFQEGEVVANGSGAEAEIASGGLGGQNGFLLVANGFDRRPVAGRSVQLAGDASSYVVRLISGSYVDSSSVLKLVLSDEKATKSSDGTGLELRDKFSQVRLTGHDFLNIGTGNKTETNYPGDPVQAPSQANEIVENRPGRVYFVSTDQDGNFRVGDFFRVEQSTGIATLNANAFDLSGLSSLRLGAVGAQVGELVKEFSSDGELSANSNSKVPTEAAIRTYFENVKSHIIPEENEVYDLGSPTRKWRDLYLSGNTINLGDSQIQSDNSTVVLPAGSKIGSETASTFSGSFTDLTNIPTTVAGYGITDAVKPGDDISTLTNNSGFVTQTELESGNLSINIGSLEGDLVGSVFADDSTVLVDSVNAVIPGTLTGRWQNLDSAFAVTAKNSSLSVGDQVGFSLATTQGAGVSIALGGVDQFGSTPDFSLATPGAVSFSSNQFTVNASSISLSGSAVDADLKGSVFADDSTLLVDGVNGSIPYSVLSDVEVTEQDLQVDFAAIVATQIQTNGLPLDTTAVGDLTVNGSLKTNTVIAESGNLDLNADNYVRIESTDNGQIEIGRASGIGNVIIGNSANGTDVNIDGNTTFKSGTTVDFTGTTISGTPFIETSTAESQFVDIAGDTMTGSLVLSGDPTANLEAATKGYVDTVAQGLKTRPADDVATDSDLDAAYSTANNTLTANTVGAINIDSANLTVGQTVLVKDQTNAYENGSYVVTNTGDASTPWVLTRDSFMNETAEVKGSFEFIQNGATYEATGWVAIVPDDFELNNTAASSDPNYATRGDIEWVQFSGAVSFTAGTGLALSGREFSNTGVLSVDSKTGSITAADIMTAVKKEDGAGSGLDADQLDGQEGAYYLDYNNFTNVPTGYTSTDFDSDFATKTTDDLSEGTNLYYTDTRARDAISAAGDLSYNSSTGEISFTERTDAEVRGLVSASGDLSYNSSTGEISFTERTDAEVRGLVSASGDLSYNSTTGEFSFTERTDAEVRGLVSASGDLSYNSTTGEFSFTERTDAEVRGLVSAAGDLSYDSATGEFSVTTYKSTNFDTDFGGKDTDDLSEGTGNLYYTDARVDSHLSGGTGVDYTSGTISIGQSVGVSDNVTFNNLTLSGNLTVSGTTTTVNTEEINLADNKILLNSNFTGSSPTENGGIEIERGDLSNKSLEWNEIDDKWTVGPETFVAGEFEGDLTGDVTGNVTGTVSDISNHTTDGLTEGTNLYYTDTRARNAISASGDLSYNSTTGEFSVTTYKSTDFDTDFGNKSTDDLSEGTNLYYTDTRARNAISAAGDLSYNSSTGEISFTERTDAEVRGLVSAGGDLSYNSTTGEFSVTTYKSTDFDTDFAIKTTDNLGEGSTNRYFSDSLARNAVSVSGDLSYNSTTGEFSFTERTDSEVRGLFSAAGDLSYNSSTGVISFTERTDAEVRGLLNAAGDLSYNSTTGEFSFTERTDSEVRGLFSAAGDLSYNPTTGVFSVSVPAGYDSTDFDTDFSSKDTDDLTEGTVNKYYSNALARAAFSALGDLSYNQSTGEFSVSVPTNTSDLTNDSNFINAYQTVTNDNSTNTTQYLTMSRSVSGQFDDVYIASSKIYFNPSTGTLNSTEFNSLSDASLKENVETLENGLDVINEIRPVSFDWKDSGERSFGVIAQEIEEVLPQIVATNDEGVKSVAYDKIIAFLIDAVKTLDERTR